MLEQKRTSRIARLEAFSVKVLRHRLDAACAFTLIELLVVVSIIAVMAGLLMPSLGRMRSVAQSAHCANSLRQLSVATRLYLNDHDNRLFSYSLAAPGGRLWYFGYETSASLSSAEGQRVIDETQGPLYRYVQDVGGVEVCPAFPYALASWKPKYKGASWGYGFNTFLSQANVLALARPSQVILFGDCAQVNTFQAPASGKNPMIEEFYIIDNSSKSVHFRHGSMANLLFLDGHVESMPLWPGTADTRLSGVNIGRISPVGSMQYLQ